MGINLGDLKKKESDDESHMIDATIVRVHQHATFVIKKAAQPAQGIGKSRGGRTTKIHKVTAMTSHKQNGCCLARNRKTLLLLGDSVKYPPFDIEKSPLT